MAHKKIGLFCKRALLQRLHSAKETYDFEEPTNHSPHDNHPPHPHPPTDPPPTHSHTHRQKYTLTHTHTSQGFPLHVRVDAARAPTHYMSLLQNIVSFIGLFCKGDLLFLRSLRIVHTNEITHPRTNTPMHPHTYATTNHPPTNRTNTHTHTHNLRVSFAWLN